MPFGTTSIQASDNLPNGFALLPNYPNPFNAATTIQYSLPKSTEVKLDIYDILGREVQSLYKGNQPAGEYSKIWLAKDIPSGVYFYKLTAGEYQQTRKMMLIK